MVSNPVHDGRDEPRDVVWVVRSVRIQEDHDVGNDRLDPKPERVTFSTTAVEQNPGAMRRRDGGGVVPRVPIYDDDVANIVTAAFNEWPNRSRFVLRGDYHTGVASWLHGVSSRAQMLTKEPNGRRATSWDWAQ